MKQIIVAYGKYSGYRITELPEAELRALAERFPLSIGQLGSHAGRDELLVVIGVHEEVERRSAGGSVERHIPSTRDLAEQVIGRGFRDLSKTHHP